MAAVLGIAPGALAPVASAAVAEVPVLHLTGTADRRAPGSGVAAIAAAGGGEVAVLDGAVHCSLSRQAPRRYREAATTFLGGLTPDVGRGRRSSGRRASRSGG